MNQWLQDLMQLRLAAQRFVDDWTRHDGGELSVSPQAVEDSVKGDSAVRRYLSLFLARLFNDPVEIKRVRDSLPPTMSSVDSLFVPIRLDRGSGPWRHLQGIALNVWMPRPKAEAGAIRIFKDYRVIDSLLVARARTVGAHNGARGQELWEALSHVPYFALTRALERVDLHTVISFLATRENYLRADFALRLSFGGSRRSGSSDVIVVKDEILNSIAPSRAALVTSFYAACRHDPRLAADTYLEQTLGFASDAAPEEVDGVLERRFRACGVLRGAEDLARSIQDAISDAALLPVSPAQSVLMLSLLRDFYLVSNSCRFFYILPVFHIAKPGAGTRLRSLSTMGFSSSRALPDMFLEGLHSAFHSLVNPLQLGDYALRQEARLLANQTRRYLTTIHHVKNDLTGFVKASERYDQLLLLAQNPGVLRHMQLLRVKPAEIAAEAEEMRMLRQDIVTALEATVGHANNSNRTSTITAEFGWIARRLASRGESTVHVAEPPPAVARWMVRAIPGMVSQHVWELVRNALRAGKERVKGGVISSYTVKVASRIVSSGSSSRMLAVRVTDTCGGFAQETVWSGLALIDDEVKTLGGRFELRTKWGRGTTVVITYPLAKEINGGETSTRSHSR